MRRPARRTRTDLTIRPLLLYTLPALLLYTSPPLTASAPNLVATPPQNTQAPQANQTINTRTYQGRLLSNFHAIDPPLIDKHGISYPSVEHAYQSSKTKNLTQKKLIAAQVETPAAWAGLGGLRVYRSLLRTKQLEKDPEFDKNRLQIMEKLLREKFSREPFRKALLDTYPHPIKDIDPKGRDIYWAVCPKGQGQNQLGKLLEKIRKDLKKRKDPQKKYRKIPSSPQKKPLWSPPLTPLTTPLPPAKPKPSASPSSNSLKTPPTPQASHPASTSSPTPTPGSSSTKTPPLRKPSVAPKASSPTALAPSSPANSTAAPNPPECQDPTSPKKLSNSTPNSP